MRETKRPLTDPHKPYLQKWKNRMGAASYGGMGLVTVISSDFGNVSQLSKAIAWRAITMSYKQYSSTTFVHCHATKLKQPAKTILIKAILIRQGYTIGTGTVGSQQVNRVIKAVRQ